VCHPCKAVLSLERGASSLACMGRRRGGPGDAPQGEGCPFLAERGKEPLLAGGEPNKGADSPRRLMRGRSWNTEGLKRREKPWL